MTFDPSRPFNDLPNLPPASETETRATLRGCIAARAALAELRVSGSLIPNQAMLINSIPLLEAQASSEIENIVTTTDRLRQYGRFLAGEPPGSAQDADRIRRYVLEHYIEPIRKAGGGQAEVLVRDVNTELGLNEAWPNICQALAGRKFRELAQIPPPERIGADQSPATVFRFELSHHRIDRSMPISPMNLCLNIPTAA